jgi:3,4-dihydroxy 2-butanone 4-phosphate synthase/GTP cyclohydrolase II
VKRVCATRLPTRHGDFTAVGYLDTVTGHEHVALVAGELVDGGFAEGDDVLVRLHSECLTGDAFGSLRCDCGPQLQASLATIAAEGRGVVVYLDGHEGRGIGLLSKLRAYALQDEGHDTVEANLRLGLPADARDYGAAAAILDDLGVRGARMLTNNPAKVAGITAYGVTVTRRVGLPTDITGENVRYLTTKRDRMGHDLPWLATVGELASTADRTT